MTEHKFLNTTDYDVFTFGVPPVCIEILTKVKGVEFNQCFDVASFQKFDGIDVRIIDLRSLWIKSKSWGQLFFKCSEIVLIELDFISHTHL